MKTTMAVLLVTLLLISSQGAAEQKKPLELTSVAEVDVTIVNENGIKVQKRVEAAKAEVVPGDPVIFTLSYVYNGDQPATNIAITNPVPDHMIYIDKSAEGKESRIDFSIDKGKSFGQLEKLVVKSASGKEKPALASDVTTIRWVLEKSLNAGDSGSVSFRARVK